MFTGIVEELGRIRSIRSGTHSAEISIEAKKICSDIHLGDSIAVNGVCLTVTSCSENTFSADIMHETLNRSSLGALKTGNHVNLERAMAAGGRFGGHMVSGHIDGTGTVKSIIKDDNAYWYQISADQKLLYYIVEKGSITIDGISLTVAKVAGDSFQVSIIPHTMKETILGEKKTGDVVNLENDIIGKYVEHFMAGGNFLQSQSQEKESILTKEYLAKYGF